MFDGFETAHKTLSGVSINYRIGGDGPPLLLLHGYPQTHVMWHKIAPRLAEDYTVICPDLRGYGDSDTPPTDENHSPYSFRAMAQDQVNLMEALGFDQFRVAGHDRGGRVTHRMVLDNPEKIIAASVLDIVPTLYLYETTDMTFAEGYYHWFFLIQGGGLPETFLGSDPEFYLRHKTALWSRNDSWLTDEAFAEYLRCFTPEVIHASCEDYRAAARIDLEHDRENRSDQLDIPFQVLWGSKGLMGKNYDVLSIWRNQFPKAQGATVPSGHFLPEEAPDETYEALIRFFRQN